MGDVSGQVISDQFTSVFAAILDGFYGLCGTHVFGPYLIALQFLFGCAASL